MLKTEWCVELSIEDHKTLSFKIDTGVVSCDVCKLHNTLRSELLYNLHIQLMIYTRAIQLYEPHMCGPWTAWAACHIGPLLCYWCHSLLCCISARHYMGDPCSKKPWTPWALWLCHPILSLACATPLCPRGEPGAWTLVAAASRVVGEWYLSRWPQINLL